MVIRPVKCCLRPDFGHLRLRQGPHRRLHRGHPSVYDPSSGSPRSAFPADSKMTKPKRAANANGAYSLEVANFGPIVTASVALRPLTVFVGPSNTGKSYLAILLYALHRSLFSAPPRRHGDYLWFPERLSAPAAVSEPVGKALTAWLSAGAASTPLPEEIDTAIRTGYGPRVRRTVAAEIHRCFGVDGLPDLVRESSSALRSSIVVRARQHAQESVLHFDFGRRGPSGKPTATLSNLTAEAPLSESADRWRAYLGRGRMREEYQFLFHEISNAVFAASFRPALRHADYLPADRTGVMHGHQVVVNTLIQSAASAGLRPGPRDTPMLSGVLADFLSQLIDIGTHRQVPKGHDLGTSIERILRGSVRVTKNEVGYPTFTYRPDEWKTDDLPLIRASSMVSELAPVVLYLRYRVRRGDVLIIEEPEAHLHPANQTALARELVRVVQRGVRVVITTHSEWLLYQIGNLVQISSLPDEHREGMSSSQFALPSTDVGVWLFRESRRPRGSVVDEIGLDRETGEYPTGFDAVSEVLYNESAEIYNRYQEAQE